MKNIKNIVCFCSMIFCFLTVGNLSAIAATPGFDASQKAITQTVIIWLKPGTSDQVQRGIIDFHLNQITDIDGINSVHIGRPVGKSEHPLVDSTYSLAVNIKFNDLTAFRHWAPHPLHKAYLARYGKYIQIVKIYEAMLEIPSK